MSRKQKLMVAALVTTALASTWFFADSGRAPFSRKGMTDPTEDARAAAEAARFTPGKQRAAALAFLERREASLRTRIRRAEAADGWFSALRHARAEAKDTTDSQLASHYLRCFGGNCPELERELRAGLAEQVGLWQHHMAALEAAANRAREAGYYGNSIVEKFYRSDVPALMESSREALGLWFAVDEGLPEKTAAALQEALAILQGQGAAAEEETRAYRLLERAASLGSREARVWAGLCCFMGRGCMKDPCLAYNWWEDAAWSEKYYASDNRYPWMLSLPGLVKSGLVLPDWGENSEEASSEEIWLEPEKLIPIRGTRFALRCTRREEDEDYGVHVKLVLPDGKGERLLAANNRVFYAVWGEDGDFALINAPVSGERDVTIFRLSEQEPYVQEIARTPTDIPGRLHWDVAAWYPGCVVFGLSSDETGLSFRSVDLPPKGGEAREHDETHASASEQP